MDCRSPRICYTAPYEIAGLHRDERGYLTGRPSRDMVIASHQELTRQWWETRSSAFDLLISELVRQEVRRGDTEASGKRMTAIEKIPVLKTSEAAVSLADQLVSAGPIPQESARMPFTLRSLRSTGLTTF